MAAIVKVLTPTTIVAADYPIAQNASLGGELRVKLTAVRARLIGIAFCTADEEIEWQYNATPTGGPLVAFVYDELQADGAAVMTYGDLTATFEPSGYARNTSFNFGCGRGVEFAGPNAVPIDGDTVPTVTEAKRGSKFGIYEMPVIGDYTLVGSTRAKNLVIPAKVGKNILAGLDRNRHSKKGVSNEAKLKFASLDESPDDGIQRFAGSTCVAMLERWKEEKLLVERLFCINYVPGRVQDDPEGDGETMLDSEGTYQHFIALPAA